LKAGKPYLSSQVQPQFVVALVEDDALLRQEIEIHLMSYEFSVHGVNSAIALDDLMARVPIDLFIIDLNLPGENGLPSSTVKNVSA